MLLGRVAITEVFHATAAVPTSEDRAVDEGTILLLVGAILTASIVVALGASRTGVPSLVAFLALGMLLGSDGPGGIDFDDAELAREVAAITGAPVRFPETDPPDAVVDIWHCDASGTYSADDDTFLRDMARVLDGLFRFCQDQVGLAPAPSRR